MAKAKFEELKYKCVGRTIIVTLGKETLKTTIADKDAREQVKVLLNRYKKRPSITSLTAINKTFRAKKEEVAKKKVATKAIKNLQKKRTKNIKKAVNKDKSLKAQILEINSSKLTETKKADKIVSLIQRSKMAEKIPAQTSKRRNRGEY